MKILLVQSMAYLYPWAGANKANRLMMEWMAAKGHECRVVNPLLSLPGFNESQYIKDNAAIKKLDLLEANEAFHHIRINGVDAYTVKSEFRIIPFIRKAVETFHPDVTLITDAQPFILLEAVVELKTKIVYIAHSQSTLPFGPDSFQKYPAATKLFKQLQGIISVSKFLDDYFRTWAGVQSKVLYFPSYGEGPYPHLGRFDNPYITVINPSALKGYCILIGLAKSMPELAFAAVPTWATAAEEIEEMRSIPNITLLKPSQDINDIYRQTKVFLMPSLWGESFGQVVVEAMLRGIPVVASNVGGLPEAKLGLEYILPVKGIEHYTTGNALMGSVAKPVVPKQDLQPWIGALNKLAHDKEHYETLSRNSFEKAQAFQSGLGFETFESYFEEIARMDGCESNPEHASSDQKMFDRVAMLSPQKREKLMAMLKEKGSRV